MSERLETDRLILHRLTGDDVDAWLAGDRFGLENRTGARFPAKLLRALERCQSAPKMVRRVGIQHALEQCDDLLHNDVAGIHFYTLNRSDATRLIFDSLGIPRHRSAQASSV